MISWFRKKALTNVAISLARNNLPGLVGKSNSNATKKFEKRKKKTSSKGVVRAGKGFTFFISYEDMNDIIQIIKSLEDLGRLNDGVTETAKYETKNQKGRFPEVLWGPLAASVVQPMIYSIVKGVSGRGVRRAERGYISKIFQFCSIL